MGGFAIEGDSDDEEFELLPEVEHPCTRCTNRLLDGLSANCVPGNGDACVECAAAHHPCD